MKKNVVVAITGASGSIYATRLLEVLSSVGVNVRLSISEAAAAVFRQELGLKLNLEHFKPTMLQLDAETTRKDEKLKKLRAMSGISSEQSNVLSVASGEPGKIYYSHYQDLTSPIASGSFETGGMVICPCSGATLAAVAHGFNSGENLIHRAAEVHLKERRPLVMVLRETPYSLAHVENMQRAILAGAAIVPASPGFYHQPKTIRDLIDFVVSRICDQLGIKNSLIERWGASEMD